LCEDHEDRLCDEGGVVFAEVPEAEAEDVAEEEDSAEVNGEGADGLLLADEKVLVDVPDDWAYCDS
jgi:hypothetical protein